MTLLAPFLTRAHHESDAPSLRGSRYLTDGRRLFRVVSQLNAGTGQVLTELEDCLTLQAQTYAPRELHAMRLRSVRAAG